jgi:DNA repair protein SbcD/Mre11
MSGRPFRFLHASDFRLDAVPHGLSEVPDHLRDVLLDAPFASARRVFDVALSERVAFVILSGNILNAGLTGPRGTAFLTEQFERLASAEISVYWAGGPSEAGEMGDPPEAWPAALPLPDHVHVFAKDRVTDFLHQSDGSPLARIGGTSRGSRPLHPGEFSPDAVGLFTIGVACHEVEVAALQAQGIHYWALGGQAERATLFKTPGTAHFPGTPQGRSPAELGPHGCTVVDVDDQGRARMTFVMTNALEWVHEVVPIDQATRREDLERLFTQRVLSLTHGSKTDLLISWTIAGDGPLSAELRRGKLRGDLLEWLRIEHGLSSPVVWPVGIEVEWHSALPPALYEQETILGDFLRAVREFEIDPQLPLDVESLLPEQHAGLLPQAFAITDKATRQRVLREAALLGRELLGGESVTP